MYDKRVSDCVFGITDKNNSCALKDTNQNMGSSVSVKSRDTQQVVSCSSMGRLNSRMRQDSSGGEQTSVEVQKRITPDNTAIKDPNGGDLNSVDVQERNTPDNIAIWAIYTGPDKIQNRTTMQENTRVGSSSSMAICRPVQGPSNIVPHDTRRHGPTPRLTTGMDIQKSSVTPNYHIVRSTTTRTSRLSMESGRKVIPGFHSEQLLLSYATPISSKVSSKTPSGVTSSDRTILEDDEEFVQTYLEKCGQFEMPSSIHERNITASTELENGDIILCDQRNKEVLLLDISMTHESTFTLTHKSTFTCSSSPHNITNIGRDKIAVTLPGENFIMVLEIDHDTLVESDFKIHTYTKCMGIEHTDHKTFYTCKNSIYIKDGENSYETGLCYNRPVSLTSERNTHVIYVCCRGNKSGFKPGEVVKLDTMSEKVVSTLSHEHLKEPVSCTVDQYGDLYVCDVQPPSCIHVARHGEYSHVVLGSVNEIYQHIRYMRHTDCFMITEKDCNVISFYRLTEIC